MNDALGLMQHHDAISGTDSQFVASDYQFRLEKSMQTAEAPYQKLIQSEFERITGQKSNKDLLTCLNSQNDTVLDCPISKNPDLPMTVIVHNPSSLVMNQFVRLRLPSNLYKVQKWTSKNEFKDTKSDILE